MDNDFKNTIFLPYTKFPMRGDLPAREPEIIKRWKEIDLFRTLTEDAKDKEKFIIHLGPPFANGNIHAGHALTTILKDFVLRTRFALGYNAPMVPGWDCHGLPIEWKIEEKYRADKKDKADIPVAQFRKECRDFALHWTKLQSQDLQRLGVVADWQNPYMTMDFGSEATIVGEIHRFLENGMLYRGIRPVMWSVVEKTALAAAEIEYHEHNSTAVFVKFPITQTSLAELSDASVVIWTTTPWSLVGNRAVAMGDNITYGLYEILEIDEGATIKVGQKILLSVASTENSFKKMKVTAYKKLKDYDGSNFNGTICAHPFSDLDSYYQFPVPLLVGDFVTKDTGTGFVSIAPGHGEDDYYLGRKNNLPIPECVADDGTYYPDVGLFAGLDVYDTNGKEGKATGAIIGKLIEANALFAKEKIRHQYPHSWRSKAPIIFRTTAQWFIAIDEKMADGKTLREKALSEIEKTTWVPAEAKNRMASMVRDRPDWCISRQRLWGVPIAIFVEKATRKPLNDSDVNRRIADTFCQESADAWYTHDAQFFLGDKYQAKDYEQIMDIVDVWFESGSTHAFVLEQRPDQQWPADLYLEGSDQHRGWFQSSLLESVGTRGKAPFKTVLTHGFVVDKDGKKMSKSAGNGLSPNELVATYGADIVRMWVLASDFHEDIRLSPDAFKKQSELYRRVRNTLKYVLGNLDGYSHAERVDLVSDYASLPDLEKWVLHRMTKVNESVKKDVVDYKFHEAFQTIYDFCSNDLSAFYFDIRKDRLYCDHPDMFERRATRTVLETLLGSLTVWLAPFIPFTAEETWAARPDELKSDNDAVTVHTRLYPDFPAVWQNDLLAADWQFIRDIRGVVTGALEIERKEKRIGASLEAHPVIYLETQNMQKFANLDWAELAITSQATVKTSKAPKNAFTLKNVAGVATIIEKADGQKCQRSWKILKEVGDDSEFPTLSIRDAEAVRWYSNRSTKQCTA